MKKTFLLFSLCIILVLSFTQAQKVPVRHEPYSGKTKFTLQKNHRDTQRGLKESLSEKWNDSLHSYNWNSALSDWSLNMREIRTRSTYNTIASRLYLSFDTITHQWVNLWLDQFEYFGSAGDLQMKSYKLWDPVTSSWIQYEYEHYYSSGPEDEYFFKDWNPVSRKFDYGYRETFKYDLNNNQTEQLEQDLDTTTALWVNYSKDSSRYNSSGIIEDIYMYWDTATSTWGNYQKTEFTYDAGNLLIETNRYSWYLTWNLNGRSFYTNNAAGLPVEKLDEYWNGSSWDTTYMIQYTYDATGTKLMTKLERNYNTITHTWTNSRNLTQTYFLDGVMNTSSYQLWNTVTNSWMTFWFTEYDTFGNQIDYYYIYIDNYTFAITDGSRYLHTYDANNRFLQEIYQDWNVATSTWEDYSKYQDTYEDPVNSYYIEELGTLWDGSSWVNDYRDVFFWSYPSGIGNLKNRTHLCFYENPMEQGEPINCPFLDPSKTYQFDLFSMKGEKIYNETVYSGTSFVINCSLSAGNYILRISENGKTVYRDKVVVLK